MHEEPLSLADICHLDPEYMAFAEGCTAHRHARVRRIAQALLASLREEIEAGIDVLDDTTLAQADRRAEALATLATGGGGFFAFRESALRGFIRRWVTRSQEGAQQRHARSASERQVQNLNVETPRVQKVNPAESVAAQGAQNMNSPPTRFCSSSLNITTTTTDPTQKNLNSSADVAAGVGRGECLVYPEGLNPNECRIAHVTLQALPADLRQSVLDELAERLHARAGTAPAIRNPLGWLHWACRELRAGHMILTSLGVRRQARRARERQAGPLKQSAAARTTPEAVRVGEAALQDMRRRLGRIRSGPEGELS